MSPVGCAEERDDHPLVSPGPTFIFWALVTSLRLAVQGGGCGSDMEQDSLCDLIKQGSPWNSEAVRKCFLKWKQLGRPMKYVKLGGQISRVRFLILFSLEKSAYSLTPPCPQLHPEREDRNASSTLGQKASFLPAQDIVLSHPLDTTLVIYSSENLATNSGSCHYLWFLRLS